MPKCIFEILFSQLNALLFLYLAVFHVYGTSKVLSLERNDFGGLLLLVNSSLTSK